MEEGFWRLHKNLTGGVRHAQATNVLSASVVVFGSTFIGARLLGLGIAEDELSVALGGDDLGVARRGGVCWLLIFLRFLRKKICRTYFSCFSKILSDLPNDSRPALAC
jgi:hypothetical protein